MANSGYIFLKNSHKFRKHLQIKFFQKSIFYKINLKNDNFFFNFAKKANFNLEPNEKNFRLHGVRKRIS